MNRTPEEQEAIRNAMRLLGQSNSEAKLKALDESRKQRWTPERRAEHAAKMKAIWASKKKTETE